MSVVVVVAKEEEWVIQLLVVLVLVVLAMLVRTMQNGTGGVVADALIFDWSTRWKEDLNLNLVREFVWSRMRVSVAMKACEAKAASVKS